MRWFALSMPLALASCALLLDTGGFSGGGEASDAGDAAIDAGGSLPDADAGVGAETSTANGCGAFDFADSFDVGDLGVKWDGMNQAGGTLSLAPMEPLSSPNALLATIVNSDTKITLTKKFAPTKHVCCEIAMRGSVSNTTIARFLGSGESLTVSFVLSDGHSGLNETLYVGNNSPDNVNGVIGTFAAPTAAWRKVRMDFTIDGANNPVRVYVDGTPAMTGGLNLGTVDISFDTLVLGIPYTQSTTGGSIRYDDVGCTFK